MRNEINGYRVYDYVLPDRVAYWLTRVQQKYNLHKSRYFNNLDNSHPFAYMNNDENRHILGHNNYQKKIDDMVNIGYISKIPLKYSPYRKMMYGYVPLIKAGGYRYINHPSIDRFYDKYLASLSDDAKYILKTLRISEFDILPVEFDQIVKGDMYQKYLSIRDVRKRKLTINEYYAHNKWRLEHINVFNVATGRSMLNFIKEDD